MTTTTVVHFGRGMRVTVVARNTGDVELRSVAAIVYVGPDLPEPTGDYTADTAAWDRKAFRLCQTDAVPSLPPNEAATLACPMCVIFPYGVYDAAVALTFSHGGETYYVGARFPSALEVVNGVEIIDASVEKSDTKLRQRVTVHNYTDELSGGYIYTYLIPDEQFSHPTCDFAADMLRWGGVAEKTFVSDMVATFYPGESRTFDDEFDVSDVPAGVKYAVLLLVEANTGPLYGTPARVLHYRIRAVEL